MSQEQLRLAYLRQQQQKQHESVLQSQNGFGHQAGDDFFASAADGLQYIEDDIEGRLSSMKTIKPIFYWKGQLISVNHPPPRPLFSHVTMLRI